MSRRPRPTCITVGDGTISVIDTINETVIATLDVMFADGFESGDTAAWSNAVP